MNHNIERNWMIGALLTLLLIGGFALDASAQQPAPAPAAPAAPAESTPKAPESSAPQSSSTPQSPSPQTQQPPSTNVQTETRTERIEGIVEREPGKFLGVDPMVALIVGAVLVIIIVFAMVAMSRRSEDVHYTHTRA
jgi:flagellar biosynthesis/type III secretory pathway M-ring protein FliF/YscJ